MTNDMPPLLLDTCAAIWIYEQAKLSSAAQAVLYDAYEIGALTYVSPITAWELGMLAARGRLRLLFSSQSQRRLFRPAARRILQQRTCRGAGGARVIRLAVHEGMDDGAVEQDGDLPRLERRVGLPVLAEDLLEPGLDGLLVGRGAAPHG